MRFATYTRDSATGNDYADQRYYSSALGRFMTFDPYWGSFHSNEPTTWNRYLYGLGDPANAADPTGLCVINGVTYPDGQSPCPDATQTTVNGGPIDPVPTVPIVPNPPPPQTIANYNDLHGNNNEDTCEALPDGMVYTASGGESVGGGSGSLGGDLLINFNTGQISVFGQVTTSGGFVNFGLPTPGGSLQTGFVWGLGNSNSLYGGPFSTYSVGVGVIAATLASTSGGYANPFNLSNPVVVTAGVQTPGVSSLAGVSNYTQPFNIGNLNSMAFRILFPQAYAFMTTRKKLCSG